VPAPLADHHAIDAYDGALATACATVPQCAYDHGAFGNIIDRRSDYSSDLNHPSIAGQAREAAIAWTALHHLHVLPNPDS